MLTTLHGSLYVRSQAVSRDKLLPSISATTLDGLIIPIIQPTTNQGVGARAQRSIVRSQILGSQWLPTRVACTPPRVVDRGWSRTASIGHGAAEFQYH